jgi:thiol-disulfide isomerase/thioredoxin
MRLAIALSAQLLLASLLPSLAAEPGPKVGDPAPGLRVSEWIKGEPVNRLKPGRVYVFEFWATWCGPCVFAMPHLSHVQRQYLDKDVTVIAVNVMDDDAGAVKAFVKKMGKTLDCHVAIDVPTKGEKEGVMAKTWLAENRAIPRCVIVDRETKVVWIGHPLRVDGPLQAVVTRTFDAAKQGEIDKAVEKLEGELGVATRDKQWQKVLAILDRMHAVDPHSTPLSNSVRIKALIELGDYNAVNTFLKEGVSESSDARLTGMLVTKLMSAADKSKLDMDLVLAVAKQASRNGGSDDVIALNALAHVYEAKEDYAAAVKVLKKMLDRDDPMIVKDNLKVRIEKLKSK